MQGISLSEDQALDLIFGPAGVLASDNLIT
jgi:hypothetical protein